MNINGKLHLGPAGPHKGKEQGVFQPDQTAADLLFPGGTHRSTVFFSAESAPGNISLAALGMMAVMMPLFFLCHV
jgi:hypothetical protein